MWPLQERERNERDDQRPEKAISESMQTQNYGLFLYGSPHIGQHVTTHIATESTNTYMDIIWIWLRHLWKEAAIRRFYVGISVRERCHFYVIYVLVVCIADWLADDIRSTLSLSRTDSHSICWNRWFRSQKFSLGLAFQYELSSAQSHLIFDPDHLSTWNSGFLIDKSLKLLLPIVDHFRNQKLLHIRAIAFFFVSITMSDFLYFVTVRIFFPELLHRLLENKNITDQDWSSLPVFRCKFRSSALPIAFKRQMNLLCLPDDCLIEILRTFELNDLGIVASVCKRLQQVAQQVFSLEWKDAGVIVYSVEEADDYLRNFGTISQSICLTAARHVPRADHNSILNLMVQYCSSYLTRWNHHWK